MLRGKLELSADMRDRGLFFLFSFLEVLEQSWSGVAFLTKDDRCAV